MTTDPSSVHDATQEEIEQCLALTGRWMEQFKKLRQWIADLKLTTWHCSIFIESSFAKPPVAETPKTGQNHPSTGFGPFSGLGSAELANIQD